MFLNCHVNLQHLHMWTDGMWQPQNNYISIQSLVIPQSFSSVKKIETLWQWSIWKTYWRFSDEFKEALFVNTIMCSSTWSDKISRSDMPLSILPHMNDSRNAAWTDNWSHDDVIKWKHFPRYWPFVRGIHRSRWIPRTKVSDAELWCFLWSQPELTVK